MGVNFELKRKITVDGKNYESLDDLPSDLRVAIQKALAQRGTATKTTVHINGKTYASVMDLPAPLRVVVGGLTALALKSMPGELSGPNAEAVRPEPVLSVKKIVVAIGLAAMLLWLARLLL